MAEKIVMIALSPTMETGTISKWHKREGDNVQSGDLLCEIETDKATMDYEAAVEGTMLKILLPEGDEASVGDPIAIVGQPGENIDPLLNELKEDKKAEDTNPAQETNVPESSDLLQKNKIPSSPLARKIAQDQGLDLHAIEGTGPAGRIIKRDVEKALAQNKADRISNDSTALASQDKVLPITAKRRIIADRLAASKYSAPHYYLKVKVAMDEILEARQRLNAAAKDKVSMNAFLVKFTAEALKKHLIVNASWSQDGIIQHSQADIGLAVAQIDGLITPVIRNSGSKGIIAIDQELKALIEKARSNRLKADEYSDATFTISNLGSYGIDEFTAIINPPGSAILAVGKIQKEAVVGENNEILIQSLMSLTLSCDHRVIDGAVGAAFLKELKDMLENPIRTLF